MKWIKQMTFWEAIFNLYPIALVVMVVNGVWFHVPYLSNAALVAPGVFFFVNPIYPPALAIYWGEKRAKLMIRIVSVVNIVFALSAKL